MKPPKSRVQPFQSRLAMSTITTGISEGIATIQLNRPLTLNALTPEGTSEQSLEMSTSFVGTE
jgi:hypothetical protein